MNTFALLCLFSCLLLVFHEVTSKVTIEDVTEQFENNKKTNQPKRYQRQSTNNEPAHHHVEEPASREDESKMQIANREPAHHHVEGPLSPEDESKIQIANREPAHHHVEEPLSPEDEYKMQIANNEPAHHHVDEHLSPEDESKMQIANREPAHHHVDEPLSPEDESKMQIVLANKGPHFSEFKDHKHQGSNGDWNSHDDQGYSSEQNITPLGTLAVYDWLSQMPQSGLNHIDKSGHGTGSNMDSATRAEILKANITPKGMEILQEWLRDIPIIDLDHIEHPHRKVTCADTVGNKNTQTEAQPGSQITQSGNGPVDTQTIKHSTSIPNGEGQSKTDITPVQNLEPSGLNNSNSDVGSPGETKNYLMRRTLGKVDKDGNFIPLKQITKGRLDSELASKMFPNNNIQEISPQENPFERQPPMKMYSQKIMYSKGPLYSEESPFPEPSLPRFRPPFMQSPPRFRPPISEFGPSFARGMFPPSLFQGGMPRY